MIDNYPESKHAMWANMGVALASIAGNDMKGAKAATEGLLAGYASDPCLPEALLYIGGRYTWGKKYAEGKEVFEAIIKGWPESKFVPQAAFDLGRCNIYSLIEAGDDVNAVTAIKEFAGDFNDKPETAGILFDMGARYDWAKKFSIAEGIYADVMSRYPKTGEAEKAKIAIPKMEIFSHIDAGDDANAVAGIEKLIADFGEHGDLAGIVYDCAARMDWRNKHEPNEVTEDILRKVVEKFGGLQIAKRAEVNLLRMGLLRIVLADGDANEVMRGVEVIVRDFNGVPEASEDLMIIASRLSGRAWAAKKAGDEEGAKRRWREDVEVRERLIEGFPRNFNVAAAHFTAGVVLAQNLGEYEKGIEYFRKVVEKWPENDCAWRAQYSVGRYLEKLRLENGDAQLDLEIIKAYEGVLSKFPACEAVEYAMLKLGGIHFGRGEYVEAADYYEGYLEKKPDGLKGVIVNYGACLEKMGHEDAAVAVYEEYVNTAEEGDRVLRVIRKRLSALKGGER